MHWRPRHRWLFDFALSLACCMAGKAFAQVPEAAVSGAERPSVGLVLSGGGARGGAHIGVLKALEELRVPVDYVAGTSIGAVVGGFYVSGMTVADLEQLIESLEWETAFLNVTPRQLKSFRRKRDDDSFLVNQKPGLNDGEFELPIGLVQGQVIDMIISRETLRASQVDNFDQLSIPFRAVAGDIVTGEPVVLRSGSLARAIRASMSIPAVLSPMEIDGRLLVDGGIAMNLPVEVARDMGADVIIAVDISSDLLGRETLRSVLDITSQLTNLLTRNGALQQRAKLTDDDFILVPQFAEDLTSLEFARMHETIQTGYDAVMQNRDALARLALPEEQYEAHLAARRDPRMRDLPVVEFVRLENDGPVADSVVEARLGAIEIGEPLDVDAVEQAMNTVYGLDYYQNVRYGLVREDGTTGIELELDARAWGPNYLQLGMEYSSAANSDSLFGLAASYLSTAINPLGGEWRATAVIGDEPALIADMYRPMGPKGLYFYAPSLNLQSTQFNVYEGDERITEAQLREATLEFAVGRELLTWGEYRFGLRAARGSFNLRVGDPSFISQDDFRRGEFFGRFSVDTMDSVAFPREGTRTMIEWRASRQQLLELLGADADFDQLLIAASHAKTWGRHTVLATLRWDATVSGTAPNSRLYRMGGFFDISGLNRNQLSGQHATRLGAAYYRRIGDLALFPAFAGMSLELGNVWDTREEISARDSFFGGSFWAGVDTPVGPVYIGYGRAEGGEDAFYVSLGRVF
jgi:NTE family protein